MGLPTPNIRKLTILAQDPSVRLGVNGAVLFAEVDVVAEQLAKGPTGYRVKVVDYDATAQKLYEDRVAYSGPDGALLDPFAPRPGETAAQREARLLGDPNFHAQNVYAIVMRTLARFERALGRRVCWSFGAHQLHVAPHAFCEGNAFYSEEDRGLLFGYFPGAGGRMVFTCLSHDVVAHETTHALLDGLRNRFTEISLPDQAGFHEGFADIVALFSAFAIPEVAAAALRQSPQPPGPGEPVRLIDAKAVSEAALRKSILMGLAKEVGSELTATRGRALRRSVEIEPDPRLLDEPEYQEEHSRGEILVAAMMRTFLRLWVARIGGLGRFRGRFYNLDRVIEEGTKLAEHLLTVAIRALDYCPPTDIDFGSFLAAMLTADAEVVPDDSRFGYREHLRRTFGEYGIAVPADACDPATGTWLPFGGDVPILYTRTHFESMLHDLDEVFRFAWENREALGIDFRGAIEVASVRPSVRQGPDGFFIRETICEYVQTAEIFGSECRYVLGFPLPAGMSTKQRITAYGSGVIVFDQYGRIKYHIANRLKGNPRQQRRLEYLCERGETSTAARGRDRFGLIHRLRIGR
jgi:hypothetical protein